MTITCAAHKHTGRDSPKARSPRRTRRGAFSKISVDRSELCASLRHPRAVASSIAYLDPRDEDYLLPGGPRSRPRVRPKSPCNLMAICPRHTPSLDGCCCFRSQHEASIAEYERAFSLNPNFSDSGIGLALVFAGEPARAIEILQANLRLDPFQNASRLGYVGHALYMLKRYPEAVPPLRECAWRMPFSYRPPLAGRSLATGRAACPRPAPKPTRVRRIEPGFTIDRWKLTAVYKNNEDAEHLFDGHTWRDCRNIELRASVHLASMRRVEPLGALRYVSLGKVSRGQSVGVARVGFWFLGGLRAGGSLAWVVVFLGCFPSPRSNASPGLFCRAGGGSAWGGGPSGEACWW